MKSCTCEAERKSLISHLNVWVNADKEYRDAHDSLVNLQIQLNTFRNRWIRFGCFFLIGLTWAIFALCLNILLLVTALEEMIKIKKPIVEEKKKLRDKAKDDLDIAKKKFGVCIDGLKPCAGCEREFKPECLTTCKGCVKLGRVRSDYCNQCFDPAIEAWELKQQENV